MAFYHLKIRRARKFVEGARQNDWDPITCPKVPGHQRAGRRLTNLFLDVLSWEVVDFSRTMLSDVVISDYALQALRAAGLSGFVTKPTRIASLPDGLTSARFPNLWEMEVTGVGGPAHKDSGITELWKCEVCGLVRYSAFENGLLVDESAYDGSDFFTVAEYPKYILTSERAKSVIETNRLTNVSFIDSSKLEWPKGVMIPA